MNKAIVMFLRWISDVIQRLEFKMVLSAEAGALFWASVIESQILTIGKDRSMSY